jgi:hypothetical protein
MQPIVMCPVINKSGHTFMQPMFSPAGLVLKSLETKETRESLLWPIMDHTNRIGEPMASRHALTAGYYGQSRFDLPHVKVHFKALIAI